MRLLLALCVLTAPALAQTTWFVDVHASPPGLGTSAAPYTSIQYAINQPTTLAGDEIRVRPGLYRESITVTKSVFIQSVGGPLVTVIRSASLAPAFTAHVLDIAPLTGFTLERLHGFAPVVDVVDWSLERCIVIGGPHAVGVAAQANEVISRCLIAGCAVGLQGSGYAGRTVRESIFIDNVVDFGLVPPSTVEYSCFAPTGIGYGPTNVHTPALVRSASGHDFHLRATSPCIDAGNPLSPLDPDGSRADIGPVPFDALYAPFDIYCTAKVNSLGCTPSVEADGVASLSSDEPFTISCTNELNNRSGHLFYGFAPHGVAYQGGYLCVHPPTSRTSPMSSGGTPTGDDCSGVYSIDFNAVIQAGGDPRFGPGVEVFAQFWSRDPSANFTSNRSNAVRFTLAP